MRSRVFRKWGVVLGMFAILMATLAPTVSQALVAIRGHATNPHAHCAMPSATMPGMANTASMSMSMNAAQASSMPMDPMDSAGDMPMDMSMDMSAGMLHGDMHGDHHAMSHGDACGYCSLLAHLPVVPIVSTPFAVTVWAIQHRVATRFDSVRRAEPLTFAQPRAPPVRS
jgi:hypothetical protein